MFAPAVFLPGLKCAILPGMTDEAPIKCVYVLYGSDTFLRDAHRKQIADRVVGDADPQICVSNFDASAELADVLDELRTLPFLAPRRLVIVRDADAFISAHREALERFLQSPPTSATLMMMPASFPATTRLAKLVKKIGEAIDCSVPARGNLGRWLAKSAGKRGKQLAPDAAELLGAWVGRDLAALDSEMEKLSLYVGDRPTIALADVGAVVTASVGPGAFDLTNAITDAKPAAALKSLAGMLQSRGDEFKTLGMIAWHLRRAMMAKEQLDAGLPANRALPKMPPQQRQAFGAMLRRRSLAAFRNDFRLLIRTDLAMKSGTKPAAALQDLVVGLCS